jgi:hypothetical protein
MLVAMATDIQLALAVQSNARVSRKEGEHVF